jgi:hypothetical protein
MSRIINTQELTRRGPARRVTVCLGREPVRFNDLAVWIEPEEGLVHLLDATMEKHIATVPLSATFIEWEDADAISLARAS